MTRRNGLVLINTGAGKGKTTAAFGLALRALGQGFKVLILQFLKGRANIGEITALTQTDLPVDIKQFGRAVFFKSRACEPIDIYLATRGLAAFRAAMAGGRYDLIVLDEICCSPQKKCQDSTGCRSPSIAWFDSEALYTGSDIVKVVPSPAWLSTSIFPPCSLMKP